MLKKWLKKYFDNLIRKNTHIFDFYYAFNTLWFLIYFDRPGWTLAIFISALKAVLSTIIFILSTTNLNLELYQNPCALFYFSFISLTSLKLQLLKPNPGVKRHSSRWQNHPIKVARKLYNTLTWKASVEGRQLNSCISFLIKHEGRVIPCEDEEINNPMYAC